MIPRQNEPMYQSRFIYFTFEWLVIGSPTRENCQTFSFLFVRLEIIEFELTLKHFTISLGTFWWAPEGTRGLGERGLGYRMYWRVGRGWGLRVVEFWVDMFWEWLGVKGLVLVLQYRFKQFFLNNIANNKSKYHNLGFQIFAMFAGFFAVWAEKKNGFKKIKKWIRKLWKTPN